jgi:hypothetical protein
VQDATQDHDAVAKAFDAKVGIKSTGSALCLVVGRVSPIAAINAVQGSVAVTLSPTRMLAVVELTALSLLQRHPDVALAGPVNIDQGRLARFAQLVGANISA